MTTIAEAPTETLTNEEAIPEVVDENAGIHPTLIDLMRRISNMEPTFKSERGLLYSFRQKQRTFDPNYGETVKDFQYEVLINPETVSLKHITHTCGMNRKSQKIYRSWKVDRVLSLSFKTVKHGHRVLRIYEHKTRTKRFRGSFTNATARTASAFVLDKDIRSNSTFNLADIIPEHRWEETVSDMHRAYKFASWAFYQLLKEVDPTHPAFAAHDFNHVAAYPMFQLFPKSRFNMETIKPCLPKNFSLHAEPDVKKFISKIFGPEGVRKDMVKAVVNTTDINSLFLAARLKHLFPLDWLRDLVKDPLNHAIYNNREPYTEAATEGLVALLSTLTLPQRKRLLVEKHPFVDERVMHDPIPMHMHVRDSIRMFHRLTPEQRETYRNQLDYTSWSKLHDSLSLVQATVLDEQYASVDTCPFEWGKNSYMTLLDGTSYELDGETFKLSAPRNRRDLRDWGNEMHNCIGGYYHEVQTHRTNVFGVYNNGALFANIEIRPSSGITQYMKKYNNPAPAEHWSALEKHIENIQEEKRKKEQERLRIQEAHKRYTQTRAIAQTA